MRNRHIKHSYFSGLPESFYEDANTEHWPRETEQQKNAYEKRRDIAEWRIYLFIMIMIIKSVATILFVYTSLTSMAFSTHGQYAAWLGQHRKYATD